MHCVLVRDHKKEGALLHTLPGNKLQAGCRRGVLPQHRVGKAPSRLLQPPVCRLCCCVVGLPGSCPLLMYPGPHFGHVCCSFWMGAREIFFHDTVLYGKCEKCSQRAHAAPSRARARGTWKTKRSAAASPPGMHTAWLHAERWLPPAKPKLLPPAAGRTAAANADLAFF